MKKKILLTSSIVVLLIGMVSFSVMAYGKWEGQGGKGKGSEFINKLNLTEEQQEKLLTIRQDFQKDTQSLRFDLQKKNQELRKLWAETPLNQTTIDAKTKEVTALKIQMANKMQVMRDKTKTILTPDQLKQFDNGFSGQGHRKGHMGSPFGA